MSDARPDSRSTQLSRGALLMVSSAACFAMMGLLVSWASAELPNAMVVFFRNALGLLVLLAWVPGVRSAGLGTRRLGGHLVRGRAGLVAMYCFFYAIARMHLADAMSLNYSMPLFLPFIEWAWLKEPVPRRLWPGLAIGFGGVLLILKPGTQLFQPLALIAIGAAVFAAVAQVGVRRLTTTEPPVRIVFYFGLIATLVSSAPLLGVWRMPARHLWGLLILVGVFATGGQILMTRALSLAPAAQVGPFIYAAVPFAAILDLLAWGRRPDVASVLGAGLIIAAGVYTVRGLGKRCLR